MTFCIYSKKDYLNINKKISIIKESASMSAIIRSEEAVFMALNINLVDGRSFKISEDTYIVAWKYQSSLIASNDDNYYLDSIFKGGFEDGKTNEDDEENKLEGLISAADWITIGKDNKNSIKTTAVMSITRD